MYHFRILQKCRQFLNPKWSLLFILLLSIVVHTQSVFPDESEVEIRGIEQQETHTIVPSHGTRIPEHRNPMYDLMAKASTIAPERTAYVAIHHERFGHPFNQISLTAVRVMFKTLEQTGTTRDRVVIVSNATSDESRKILAEDGFIVLEANVWPYEDMCSFEFRRLDMFNLTQYDRIIFIDNDVLVDKNMDMLFACGHYCLVYNSLIHFTDAVMVVKPSVDTFNTLYRKYQMLNFSEKPPHSCLEESWGFWLNAFGNIERAPLFHLPPLTQSELPQQRLPANVALNAMLWYEKFSWALMQHGIWQNQTNPLDLPGLAISFATQKPYYWDAGVFFNLNWFWQSQRLLLLGDDGSARFLLSSFFGLSVYALFVTIGLRALFALAFTSIGAMRTLRFVIGSLSGSDAVHPTNIFLSDSLCKPSHFYWWLSVQQRIPLLRIFSLSQFWLPRFGADFVGWMCLPVDLFIGYMMYIFIPQLTPPQYAWPIFITLHQLSMFAFLHIIALYYSYKSALLSPDLARFADSNCSSSFANSDMFDAFSLPLQSPAAQMKLSIIKWSYAWSIIGWASARLTIYPDFIVKMLVLFPFIVTAFWSHIDVYRYVFQKIELDIVLSNAVRSRKKTPSLPCVRKSRSLSFLSLA